MREIANPGESESQGHIDPTLVFGWLCAGLGIGNVVSGPLSEVLIQLAEKDHHKSESATNSNPSQLYVAYEAAD